MLNQNDLEMLSELANHFIHKVIQQSECLRQLSPVIIIEDIFISVVGHTRLVYEKKRTNLFRMMRLY